MFKPATWPRHGRAPPAPALLAAHWAAAPSSNEDPLVFTLIVGWKTWYQRMPASSRAGCTQG